MAAGAGGGLTFRVPRPRRSKESRGAAWGVLVLAFLFVLAQEALAARVAVVLSDDSVPYEGIYQAIQAGLAGSSNAANRLYARELTQSSLGDARMAVVVGVGAADAMAALGARLPVLAVLVPRTWYLKTGQVRLSEGGRRVLSAIYIDQPFERQARLIQLALPEARRVGVLLSAEQQWLAEELRGALEVRQLDLVEETVAKGERLIGPLEKVLAEVDLLLAVPDPLVFNRGTAQSVFLTSYRFGVPIVGYSQSLTRAGALVSLHSSPAQIGRQAAAWVNIALRGPAVRLPAPAYPEFASVSVNEQVAHSLGITVPPEAELEERLWSER